MNLTLHVWRQKNADDNGGYGKAGWQNHGIVGSLRGGRFCINLY